MGPSHRTGEVEPVERSGRSILRLDEERVAEIVRAYFRIKTPEGCSLGEAPHRLNSERRSNSSWASALCEFGRECLSVKIGNIDILEKEIQRHIWRRRRNWRRMIDFPKSIKKHKFADDLHDLTPARLAENLMIQRMNHVMNHVRQLELMGCEVPLPRMNDSTIRADFLGSALGREGIAVIELKRDNKTERESFTELLAYANHFASTFPGMTRDDVIQVLIAPMKSRIVRDAVVNTLLFDRKPVVALQPYLADGSTLGSLRMTPWVPDRKRLRLAVESAFSPESLTVEKIVWEEDLEFWGREEMEHVAHSVAIAMEQARINGFVFASKSNPKWMFPNAATMVAVNPYGVANRLKLLRAGIPEEEVDDVPNVGLRLMDFLPGLKKNKRAKRLHKEFNYFEDLWITWDSHLLRIGMDVVKRCLRRSDGVRASTDRGSMSWGDYQGSWAEDIDCQNYSVYPTGLVRELYWSVIDVDYDIAGGSGGEHPVVIEVDKYANSSMRSQHDFRLFLQRMLRPTDPHGIHGAT